jgi:integrase
LLTEQELKRLGPLPVGRTTRKLFDTGGVKGLYFLQEPSAKGWRLRYWLGGKEKSLSLGPWPEVSLAQARTKAKAVRAQIKAGVDPSAHRKAHNAVQIEARARTFGSVGADLLQHDDTRAPRTRAKHAWLFSLLRSLHGRPIGELKTVDLVRVLKAIESDKDRRETAHRAAMFAARVFRHAIQNGYIETNPAGQLRGALKPIKVESHAAITDPEALGDLLRFVDLYPPARAGAALRLAPYVFVRPGELRQMEWSELDLRKAEWIIPAPKTKMRRPHLVFLARQVVEMLRTQEALTGGGRWVFPGRNNAHRPLSDAALSVALGSLFYDSGTMTPHGFRATASSLLNGELHYDSALVELALGHVKRDRVAGIYDRSQRLPERRELYQRWADYLDQLRTAASARAAARG